MEKTLAEIPKLIERTEKDYIYARKEGNQIEAELRRIEWKLDKEHSKKYGIEEGILKQAQDTLINDKASQYRLKLLKKSQEIRRGMELSLAQVQNQLAQSLLELEKLKGLLIVNINYEFINKLIVFK